MMIDRFELVVALACAGAAFACTAARPTGDAPTCESTVDDPHNCGACGHDCLGGTCSAGTCAAVDFAPFPLVDPGSRLPNGPMIAVDASEVFVATGEVQGGLVRMPIDGGAIAPLAGFASAVEVTHPTVADGALFFDDQGMGLEGLVEEVPVGATTAAATHAIDAQASVVYTVDATDLFWMSGDRASHPIVVRSARGSSGDAFTIATLDTSDGAFALAANDATIVVLTTQRVLAVPKAGASSAMPIASAGLSAGNDANAERLIAADQSSAYWVSDTNGTFDGTTVVRRAPLAGGDATVIATSADGVIREVVADGARVYWLAVGASQSRIVAYDEATAETTTLVRSPVAISDLAVSGGALWWVTDAGSSGAVHRLAL